MYRLEFEQWFPGKLREVFLFFADAGNLELLTPPWLRFRILTPQPIHFSRGSIIDYRLSLHGFPVRWRTKILVWNPPRRFVDKQIRGPYRHWVHEHLFTEHEGGTLVRDHIDYDMWLGPLVHQFFVRRDLEAIFRYRREILSDIFKTSPSP